MAGLPDLALAEDAQGPCQGRCPPLPWLGYFGPVPRQGSESDPRVEKGFQLLLSLRQDDGAGLARRAHGLRGATVEPPGDRHGLARLRVLQPSAAPRARRVGQRSFWPRASCSPIAMRPQGARFLGILTEPRFYTTHSMRSTPSPASGLGKENSGVRTAEAYLLHARRTMACGIRARRSRVKARRRGLGPRQRARTRMWRRPSG